MPRVTPAAWVQLGSLSLAAGALAVVLTEGPAQGGANPAAGGAASAVNTQLGPSDARHETNQEVAAVAASNPAHRPTDRLELQLDALQSSISYLLATVDAQDARIDALDVQARFVDDEISQEEDTVVAEDRGDELFDSLEATLQQEFDDPDWARSAERDIEIGIATAIAPEHGELNSIECRSSLCRLETVHADQFALDGFMQSMSDAISWDHDGFVRVEEDADGSKVAVVIVTRDD